MVIEGRDLIAFLIALARMGAFVIVAPPFNTQGVIPYQGRVLLAVALAMPATGIVAAGVLPTTTPELIGTIALQAVTGFAFGFVVLVLFSAFSTAGALGDLFGGIVLPPSLDPLSQNQVPLVGQLFEQVALVLLFVTNGEFIVLRGLLLSFSATGLGLQASGGLAHGMAASLETLFVSALEIATPLLVVLFAAQVVLALLAKAAPQMNVFLLGFPLQVLATILMVALAIQVLPSAVDRIVERILVDFGDLIRLGRA